MKLIELSELVYDTFTQKINDGSLVPVKPERIGLHEKAGEIYLDTDERSIVVHQSNMAKMRFYGGFDYVDKEKVVHLGEYVLFMPDIERVKAAFEIYEANHAIPAEVGSG